MTLEISATDFLKLIDFSKSPDGLVPAIVQDDGTGRVLMLGYMNDEAVTKTIETKLVTFFSRSKQRLWTKGESSDNFLHLMNIYADCDNDTILVKAQPDGPVCHTGSDTCFNEKNVYDEARFLAELESVITDRRLNPQNKSYTSELFAKGINTMAQKVGEEAIELVIESIDNDDTLFLNEAADLLFHYLVLLQAKGKQLGDVVGILKERHRSK